MADQILTFRSGFKRKKTPGNSPAPQTVGALTDATRTDAPHTEDRSEGTIKLIARGRERKLRLSRILSVFKHLLTIRTIDVLGRPKNRIQFMLWVAVLATTGVSAVAMVLGALDAPQPTVETVDTEGFEETVEVHGAPQKLTPPESVAIAPALDPAALNPAAMGAEPAVGVVERLDAGPSLTQMSGDAATSYAPNNLTPSNLPTNSLAVGNFASGNSVANNVAPKTAAPINDVRGAWLDGTIQDEALENVPYGR